MKRAGALLVAAPMVLLALSACTESNPAYVPGDSGLPPADTGRADGAAGGDGAADAPQQLDGPQPGDGPQVDAPLPPDTKPWPDTQPWPDVVPWQCNNSGDCDDKIPCTVDTCTAQKKCDNKLQPNTCLIGATCYKADDLDPTNSCQACKPATDAKDWTALPNNTGCQLDGKSCTYDLCQAGQCTHPVVSGHCYIGGDCYSDGDSNPQSSCQVCDASSNAWATAKDGTPCASDGLSCTSDSCLKGACDHVLTSGCLINGACVSDGAAQSGNPCNECVSGSDSKDWTFITGKPCSSGSGLARICYASTCKGWTEASYDAPSTAATELEAVNYIDPASGAWAVGTTTSSAGPTATPPGGVLIDAASPSNSTTVVSKSPLHDLHWRIAVGDDGASYYHNGSKWVQLTSLTTALGGRDRYGVWSALVAGVQTAYFSGYQNNSAGDAGVLRCAMILGQFQCINQTGFEDGALMGKIFGSLGPLNTQGRLWAPSTDRPGSEDEDIYTSAGGLSTSWTRAAPHGCQDGVSGAPCSNTSGELYNINGSDGSDVWVVGSYGNLLHYDGSGWTRLENRFPGQGNYTLLGAYSSPADKLVILVGFRQYSSGRNIIVATYNSALKRWFGPIQVRWAANNYTDELRDIGGQSFKDLYMVGRQRSTAGSGSWKTVGWILRFN